MENEIELIKGCRAGKDSARKELYTLYSKQMLAVCFRYTGDMDVAHDVLHDGFIKIFTNCRTVFNLYVFEEKSHKEIAKLLRIKEHSSTSQLHRAKYLLAKRIKEYRNHEERK